MANDLELQALAEAVFNAATSQDAEALAHTTAKLWEHGRNAGIELCASLYDTLAKKCRDAAEETGEPNVEALWLVKESSAKDTAREIRKLL